MGTVLTPYYQRIANGWIRRIDDWLDFWWDVRRYPSVAIALGGSMPPDICAYLQEHYAMNDRWKLVDILPVGRSFTTWLRLSIRPDDANDDLSGWETVVL